MAKLPNQRIKNKTSRPQAIWNQSRPPLILTASCYGGIDNHKISHSFLSWSSYIFMYNRGWLLLVSLVAIIQYANRFQYENNNNH